MVGIARHRHRQPRWYNCGMDNPTPPKHFSEVADKVVSAYRAKGLTACRRAFNLTCEIIADQDRLQTPKEMWARQHADRPVCAISALLIGETRRLDALADASAMLGVAVNWHFIHGFDGGRCYADATHVLETYALGSYVCERLLEEGLLVEETP